MVGSELDTLPHRFRVGAAVRVVAHNPAGNPRTPLHVRGKRGVVALLHGIVVNPADHRALYPPLCSVLFTVAEVFGGSSADSLLVDLHEDWLEPA